MYLDADTIVKIAAVIGALSAIGTVAYKIIKWIQEQEKQSKDIEKLKEKQAADIQDLKDEQFVISYAIFACLDGLKQLKCNGTVTEAHNKLEEHINQRAHSQK